MLAAWTRLFVWLPNFSIIKTFHLSYFWHQSYFSFWIKILECYDFGSYHSVWKSTKMSHLNFWILAFSTNFCLITILKTLFDRKLQFFKNSPKWTIFGIFNYLLSTRNVNVARFARNVEWGFFCNFQTPWAMSDLERWGKMETWSLKSAHTCETGM